MDHDKSSPIGQQGQALLVAQVREADARICCSRKTQEMQADICHEQNCREHIIKVALTRPCRDRSVTAARSADARGWR
ncbi:hypothetical protein GCM10010413_10080 [Promicromonospora sukumoe]